MVIEVKKIPMIFSIISVIFGSNDIRCMKLTYNPKAMNQIIIKLKGKSNANDVMVALYTEDTGVLTPEEITAVQAWKKRLHQHLAEERGHFAVDPSVPKSEVSRQHKKSSTYSELPLEEGIKKIAAAEGFKWSKGGNNINVEPDTPLMDDRGKPVEVTDEQGTKKNSKGVKGTLLFSDNAANTDVGTFYLE
ncbi:MAG: hypothetical protein LBO73_00210 [Holosporaceae bacterium]|jgi:hypothetical protein|nr:hypothetical protein [Holosporaceae bacterium]